VTAVVPLSQWLAGHGLEKYAPVFAESAVGLDVLSQITETDLKDLGIPLGDRKRILAAIKSQDTAAPRVAPTGWGPARVSPGPQADRRQLTVLFCDLVGSTALSQKLDPEALRDLMRAYREACVSVVEKYNGNVAQYLGDGMMIYFGWPQAHEDDAERALRCALDIVTAIKTVDAPSPLRVHIGIATGTVVVGESAGSDVESSRLATGETPNLAARLQGMAGADEIVVGPSTQRLAGGRFDFEDLGEHTLKGIVEPVRAYRVKGMLRVEGRFEAHTRQLTPMIGRTSEVGLLLDRWERAKEGEGQSVLLSAEPGIGKSRITRALRERIAAEPHVSLHYQCSPFHGNSAFYPIVEQFERAAGFAHEDTPRERIAKMEATLGKAQTNAADIAPLYAAMLSLPAESYPAMQFSPQQQKERIITALVAQVMGLAAQKPVMMVLEDAHWADPSTLETFGTLLERIDSARVLLLVTYRPEFSTPWLGQSRVTVLTLARLSKKETASLAEQVSGKPLPAEVLDQILAKTDGVPLFVEELTKSVLESGLLQDAGDRYTVSGALPPLAIPSTLYDSLMARLDRLAHVKELIQLGAVIGREFTHNLIATLAPVPASQLDAALEQLVVAELVFRRGKVPDAIYAFKHALLQDAAYESILKSRRPQLHANVATALELDPQIAQSDPGFLALQFERAGLNAKAIEWYIQAAGKANLRSANKEALHHSQRALALLDDASPGDGQLERRIDLYTEIGLIHMVLEGWASRAAMEHLVEAEKLCRDGQQSERRFRTLVGMIQSLEWYGRHSEAKSFAQELVALAEESGNRIHRLFAHQLSGQVSMYEGKFLLALSELDRASALYDDRIDSQLAFQYGYDPALVALWNTAYVQWETGALDQSLASSEDALLLGRRIGHPFSLASSLSWTIDLSSFMWLPERILQYFKEGMDVTQRFGFSQLLAICSFQHGWALAQDGRYEIAIEEMTHALDQYKALGAAAVIAPRLTAQLASVYGQAGRADEGLLVLHSSPDRVPGRKRVRYAEISRIEGELQLLKTEPEPVLAEQFFQEAIEIAIEDQARAKQLRAVTSLAKLWRMQGKIKEAKELLHPVYDSFTEGFDMPDMKNAKALLESLDSRAI
jgi:class 3 adenylate cyclase/tetratricopeptide (TPR) repeat protein